MKYYQITFCWKKPRLKKSTSCASPFIHTSYEAAKEYAEDVLAMDKRKAQYYENRNVELVHAYYIDEVLLMV